MKNIILTALIIICLALGGCAVARVNADGSQTLLMLSGDEFTGQGAMDLMNGGGVTGRGRLNMKNGDVYLGPVVNGKPHGQGKLSRQNGEQYEGGFVEGLYHGEGRLLANDGTEYQGGFEFGNKHGRGREIYQDRNGTYDVAYKKGRLVSSTLLIERDSRTTRITEK
jgi:hypothetical protein